MNVGSGYAKGRRAARACVLVSVMAGMNANGWHYERSRWVRGPKVVNYTEFKHALPALQALGL